MRRRDGARFVPYSIITPDFAGVRMCDPPELTHVDLNQGIDFGILPGGMHEVALYAGSR